MLPRFILKADGAIVSVTPCRICVEGAEIRFEVNQYRDEVITLSSPEVAKAAFDKLWPYCVLERVSLCIEETPDGGVEVTPPPFPV